MTMPYGNSQTVTPSDTANFTDGINGGLCDALYVGGAGTVTVVYQNGATQQFTCPAGTLLPVRCKRVNSTGTAGTPIVALYYT